MIDKNLSDEAVISIFRLDGNSRYFSLITDRYETYIIKKCMGYVKDEAVAEDLCQEILLKIFLKAGDFKGEAKFKTWLHAIVHNTCIDYLRKAKKNTYQVLTQQMSDNLIDIIDDASEISEELSEQVLTNLMKNISEEDRLLLLLKYKDKHSIKDIQASMHLSESAVKMRLKRAKEKINRLYMSHKGHKD